MANRPKIFLLLRLFPAVVTVVADPTELSPARWTRRPVAAIKPKGWLETQARLQANALTLHLPYFWPNIANTSWLGGDADNVGEIHESTPYWLNGAVPLAFQLNHTKLINIVEHYVDEILQRQNASGWLGPDTDPTDFWSRYAFVLALVQYHEVQPLGSPRSVRCLEASLAFLKEVGRRLDSGTPFVLWSAARSHDLIWAIHYFVDVLSSSSAFKTTSNPDYTIVELLSLATRLHEKGFDWHGQWFGDSKRFPTGAVHSGVDGMWSHGVNNAQAVKHGAVWSRQSANASASIEESLLAWRQLMRYHGLPHGMFSADEHLAGKMPSRGTELCAVVESMWSLALLAQHAQEDLQAKEALDALEHIAFNALPGGISDDLWAHPYLQFPNTFQAVRGETDHIWANDGPDAAMYGLAPNYECCTSNFHQGYPKLIANLFYEVPRENVLISAIWAPSSIQTSSAVGGGFQLDLQTDYPFGLSAEYHVANPEPFTLRIRLPAFLRKVEGPHSGLATLRVWMEGHEQVVQLVDGFLTYRIPAWPLPESRVAVRLEWSAPPQVHRMSAEQGSSVFVGPLLLVPDLREIKKQTQHYAYSAADWDIKADGDWRFGIGPPHLRNFGRVLRRDTGERPFGHGAHLSPLVVNMTLLRVAPSNWTVMHSAPGPLPNLTSGNLAFEERSLVPYACSAVRLASLPELSMDIGDQASSWFV